jgi:hypothetical protein
LAILILAPAPLGFTGGGPAGYAFMFFILSIPAGILVSLIGKAPELFRRIVAIAGGSILFLYLLSILANLASRSTN